MRTPARFLVLIVAASLLGCEAGRKSSRGFTLPDGDADRGRDVYIALQCNACHSIPGIERADTDTEQEINVALGGEVTHIQTYGELVTSIINPSHRLAKGYPADEIQQNGVSRMRNYNEVMTVSQLIDLVAFLQSQYSLIEYEPTDYPIY